MTVVTQQLHLMSRPIRYRMALAVALTGVAAPAFAQIAGGGGNAGLLSQVINWVATNIIGGLIAAGVIFVGCLLLFGRHTLAGVAVMVIGAIVISQYQTIAAFFGIGG
jgi:type IV secretory pathway VirB2 component (pilin)